MTERNHPHDHQEPSVVRGIRHSAFVGRVHPALELRPKQEKPAAQTTAAAKANTANVGDRRKLEAQIGPLWDQANACIDSLKYADALPLVRELVAISRQLPDNLEFQEQMLDTQHFLMLKTAAFREALQNGFDLDTISRQISPRPSPWNCLKIADAYLGLRDPDNALLWIEKAVNERGFNRLDAFQAEEYSELRTTARFARIQKTIEDRIGINLPAREFTVKLLDGSTFSLSDQRGKVVLIDFWDVQCPPCRKEMPNMKKMHREFAAKGLVIVGISLDTNQALLQKYLAELSPEWKMACSLKGWKDDTALLYGINSTPSSWLIDRKGVLRHLNLRGENLYNAVTALL